MTDITAHDLEEMGLPRDYDPNCLNNFMNELADEITGACMIPMNLPKKEVYNIIQRAKKWFYKNYEYSVQENFLVIPETYFGTEVFKRTRSMTLPGAQSDGSGAIFSVYGVYPVGTFNGAGTDIRFTKGDFNIDRLLFGGMLGQGTYDIRSAENLQYYVVQQSYYDMARQIINNPISFNYSQLTRNLKIMGETPKNHLILEVYQTIPDCALFEDEIFFRYCSAKIKISLGSKLSIFDYNLPGDVKINADNIKSMGDEELDKVIEEIKGDEGVDWMMHS
jgi:hypothetical protein